MPITRSGIIVRANPLTVMATPPAIVKIDRICLGVILIVFCSLVEDSSFLLKIECSPKGYIRFLVLKIKKIPSTLKSVEGIIFCGMWDSNPRRFL